MDKTAWLAAREIAAEWPARGNPARHSRRQRRRVPRFGLRAGLRRARRRARLPPAGNAAVRRPYRAADRHDDGRRSISFPGRISRACANAATSIPRRRAIMTLRELETYLALEIVGVYHARIHRSLARRRCGMGGRVSACRASADADGSAAVPDRFPSRPNGACCSATGCISSTSDTGQTNCAADGRRPRKGHDQVRPARPLAGLRASWRRLCRGPAGRPRTRPAIALWEHRAAVASCATAGRRAVDEEQIFSTILAQRALVDAAGAATKAARREVARRAHLAPPAMIDVTPATRESDPRAAAATALFRGGGMG